MLYVIKCNRSLFLKDYLVGAWECSNGQKFFSAWQAQHAQCMTFMYHIAPITGNSLFLECSVSLLEASFMSIKSLQAQQYFAAVIENQE